MNITGGLSAPESLTVNSSSNIIYTLPILIATICIIIIVLICFIPSLINFLVQKKKSKTTNERKQLAELKKCIKLLDKGVITQEEYEQVKKRILNL